MWLDVSFFSQSRLKQLAKGVYRVAHIVNGNAAPKDYEDILGVGKIHMFLGGH
jgi:hypothetical protein